MVRTCVKNFGVELVTQKKIIMIKWDIHPGCKPSNTNGSLATKILD